MTRRIFQLFKRQKPSSGIQMPIENISTDDISVKCRDDVIREFLSLPMNANDWTPENWKVIRNRCAFLNVDWGEETREIINFWNELVDEQFHVRVESAAVPYFPGFTDRFTYKDRCCEVPYTATRNDCFIAVVTLCQLVNDDVDLRFCKDSVGNSDYSFLPLSPEQWTFWEAEYSRNLLELRFLKLPKTFEEFGKILDKLSGL